MKILTTAMAAALCFSLAARAETKRSTHVAPVQSQSEAKLLVGVDANFGMPLGNYADANGIGAGVLLTGEYPVMPELSATFRAGFNFHSDKNVLGADTHIHNVPVLLGAKYYFQQERQGFFGAAELGVFDLMASSAGVSQSDLKFGAGVGAGYSWKQWNARVNLHTQDFGHFGDMMMLTAGVGYQFAGF